MSLGVMPCPGPLPLCFLAALGRAALFYHALPSTVLHLTTGP